MEKSFPFNAVVTDGVPDRVYSAEDLAAERAAYVKNGVHAEGDLRITPSSDGTLAVEAAAGGAVIDGYTYFNTAPLTLAVGAAHASLSRIDRAVLRLDLEQRRMYCVCKTGAPAIEPAVPELLCTDTVRELPLAQIRVEAGVSVLTQESVTDERTRADYILNRLEVEETLARYEQALKAYFDVEDAAALAEAARTVRTDASADTVLCGDGQYRPASLDGFVYEELVRFTEDGTFSPAQYPTRDGRYHVILQGAGGSGAYGSEANLPYGGEAGGFISLAGIPLRADASYAVTVGRGGEGTYPIGYEAACRGKNGGNTSFAGYTALGGRGGVFSAQTTEFETPTVTQGYAHSVGTAGSGGAGGDSFFAPGGKNRFSGAGGAGSLGSGGGSGYRKQNDGSTLSGPGGDGVVIICGARPL